MSSMTPLEKKFSAAFVAGFGNHGHCLPFAKGRVALYAGLKALDLPPESPVILPAYTCVVVASAIQFAGLKPLYVDIDPATYNINPNSLPPAAALIAQHSYGIPADMDALAAHGAALIEDCCHVFSSSYKGQRCGTFGKFSFFSGQWNKFFSSGLGGFFYTTDPDMAKKTGQIFESAQIPGMASSLRYALQIMAYKALVTPATEALITKLYRRLTRMGIAAGSSDPAELQGREPENYFTRLTAPQLYKGLSSLARIENNIAHRRKLGNFYHAHIADTGFAPLTLPSKSETVFLRYPVRVGNKTEFLEKAAKHGIEIGSWFETPLHGNHVPLEVFGYRPGSCPIAEKAAREAINLPTHQGISEGYAEKILDFLKQHGRPL